MIITSKNLGMKKSQGNLGFFLWVFNYIYLSSSSTKSNEIGLALSGT